MAALDTHRVVPAPTGVIATLRRAAHVLVAKLVDWNDARLSRKMLNKLSDQELWDIGLSRSDIDTLIR